MKDYQQEITFPSDDVATAVNGPGHNVLDRIQKEFTVTIRDRGHQVTVFGKNPDRIKDAVDALKDLIIRAQKGQVISEATVDDYLRLRGASADAQMELFVGGKRIAARSANQARMLKTVLEDEKRLVFALGDAGTGKTFLAVAIALSALKKGRVDKVVISRPAVAADEEIGFLPGDMDEKLSPYVQPVYDAVDKLIGKVAREKLIAVGEIEVIPTGFMRGRTFERCFVIADESQNLTFSQMKMVLTRIGEGSTMVITGDPYQNDIDLPPDRTALMRYSRAFDASKDPAILDTIGIIHFGRGDVVRDPIVRLVLDLSDKIDDDHRS